jgi:hypothetical protein
MPQTPHISAQTMAISAFRQKVRASCEENVLHMMQKNGNPAITSAKQM